MLLVLPYMAGGCLAPRRAEGGEVPCMHPDLARLHLIGISRVRGDVGYFTLNPDLRYRHQQGALGSLLLGLKRSNGLRLKATELG